jgi:hypothetical protein
MYACGDTTSPLAPRAAATRVIVADPTTSAASPAAADRAADGSGNHGHKVRALRWTNRLHSAVVVRAVIGPKGGTIRMPKVGAVFTVPAGALATRTTITMRAIAGRNVVFDMGPNGLKFAQPATLTLDLSFTNAYHNQTWGRLLSGGYITSSLLIGADDGVTTYEDEAATVDDAVTTASFPVPHFSVVILASQYQGCCTTIGGRH